MLIPRKPKRSRQSKKDWFNKEKIKKPVKKELAEKTKKLIEKKSKSHVKEVVFSYMCSGCRSSFSAGNLRKQIIEAARRKDTYISCPKCGSYLVADRTTKVSTKQNSKVNRNANLTITYPNQGINITPSYTPSSWIDRSILERIAHELGKYCQKFGFFNPQLKFQRGIRGKVSVDAPENVKAAEYIITAVDDYDLGFRVVAAAGITPAGKVVLPKFFMTLDGREIPFTKEAVAEFLSGKVFGSTDPKPVVPELHYKDRDPVRFREIVASRKKKAALKDPTGHYREVAKGIIEAYEVGPEDLDDETLEGAIHDYAGDDYSEREWLFIAREIKKLVGKSRSKQVVKKAAGTPTPGQTVEYQGKNYTIDSITGDASILTDEAGVQTAPVPNADLNVQFEEGAMPAEISAPTLADRINKLVKRSLRDEKTLVPFTDPAPDYSVAKQTDVDADFSVPYKDSDQGILSEEERAVQKMFRGGAVIKPVKTAQEIEEANKKASIKKTAEEIRWEKLLSDFSYAAEKEGGVENWVRVWGGSLDNIDSIDKAINDWASENGLEVTDDDVLELRTFLITQAKTSSIKKVAEPTGYHETDDTGKVIELSRLRTLVQDYARAGQIPLDFDLTKVMSEVSRMTRKDLLEILDKKQKDTHYPVVHAKKEGLEKKAGTWALPFTVNRAQRLQKLVDEYAMKEEYDPEALQSVLNVLIGDDELYDDLDKAKNSAEAVELIKARLGYFLSDYEEDPENFRDKLEAPAKEILVGIVTASNKKVLKIGSKSTNAIVREIRKKALVGDLTEEDVKKDIKEEKEGEKHYNQMAKDVGSPKTEKVLKDMADEEAEHAEDLEEIVLPAVKNTQNYLEKYDSRKKKAQEEGEEEEKPKTTLKELKTKPHGRPAAEEVAEAPAAAPELQKVFNEVKQHQQRLTEIKAIISAARQKTEEEIRKIQEEQGSVEEAAELQEGIEKLSSLIEQSESQIVDLGEFFVWLDTEAKTKKFKPSDKWRVEKLLEKFGKDAEEYLAKAERGAASLNDEIEQRLLTVFPKLPKDKEGSIQKKADVLSAITELGSGLWSYIKELSGIISEGEQLELALE